MHASVFIMLHRYTVDLMSRDSQIEGPATPVTLIYLMRQPALRPWPIHHNEENIEQRKNHRRCVRRAGAHQIGHFKTIPLANPVSGVFLTVHDGLLDLRD